MEPVFNGRCLDAYEAYFKAASDSLDIVDHSGRMVEANPKAVQLCGCSQNKLIGQPVELLLPERQRPQKNSRAPRKRVRDGDESLTRVLREETRNSRRARRIIAAMKKMSSDLSRDLKQIEDELAQVVREAVEPKIRETIESTIRSGFPAGVDEVTIENQLQKEIDAWMRQHNFSVL